MYFSNFHYIFMVILFLSGSSVTKIRIFLSTTGQSTKACELFLKNRAAAVQTAIRQLRIEGATSLYIHKLCNIFFTSLLETAKEFEMDFAGNTGCYSAFVVWSRSAMKMFVDAFSKQVDDMLPRIWILF